MVDTVTVDVSTVASIYNDVYRRPFEELTANHVWTDGNTFEIDNTSDVTFTLPLAADFPREDIYINRTGSNAFLATILPSGSDTVGTVSYFVLAKRGENVRLRSDGVSNWRLITRQTQAIASIGQTSPTVYAVTTSPTVLDVFNKTQVSTRQRIEALADSIEIIQIDINDQYRINFTGTFTYQVNQNLTIQLYAGGVAVPEAIACAEGNNSCAVLSWAGIITLSNPVILDLRVTGNVAANTTIVGMSFIAERLGG